MPKAREFSYIYDMLDNSAVRPLTRTLDLPIGGIYQATTELAVYLGTNIAHIGISNTDAKAYFGADFIPLLLGASFALSPTLDLEAEIESNDVGAFSDDYRLFFGIRLDM